MKSNGGTDKNVKRFNGNKVLQNNNDSLYQTKMQIHRTHWQTDIIVYNIHIDVELM